MPKPSPRREKGLPRKPMPVLKAMCGTCPFRPGSPHADLALPLTASALTEASRICHSTGRDNAINEETGKPEALCRGARDVQLRVFCELGVIEKPTDEAWNEACKKYGLPAH